MKSWIRNSLTLLWVVIVSWIAGLPECHGQANRYRWPPVSREAKPWTRWWWHGSAVTREGITADLEALKKAGIGGVEITPIYGVYGYEDKFIPFLSPEWMDVFKHTLNEAQRLGLGVDMATGTGWPFGGPWIGEDDACRNLNYKVYALDEGQELAEKIEFIQQPEVHAIGRNIPGHDKPRKKITVDDLVEPVSANKDLQSLALDQVRFKRALPLTALIAYGSDGQSRDLLSFVNKDGKLSWRAPAGSWKIYALFEGWHGKMVERAGPGGEGNVIDHFSGRALQHYLAKFDDAFKGNDVQSLRAFFNDSYEVDDARGAADWTPAFFDEFRKRRGYDLKLHLAALFGHDTEYNNNRILSDYRETVSELLLENFTKPWAEWAHTNSAFVRNQAHGSPANILDLYATVDVPEIEGIEPLRIRMASSAGNVTGKVLVSSESATWLREHFQSNLGDIKMAADRFFLNGVNHIFYHGTCYSPPSEPWPGWLFYAAVHVNPRNSLWNDFNALNDYIARCQSFLQNSKTDNDVLLYYPIYDAFAKRGNEMVEHFDGIGSQFKNTAFERGAEAMLKKGYSFDFISDKQLAKSTLQPQGIKTEGGSIYKTIVIPHSSFIPMATLQKILSLAEGGATVIAFEGLPEGVAGFANLVENEKAFKSILARLEDGKKLKGKLTEYTLGQGRILLGNNIDELLAGGSIARETLTDLGLQFIRKQGRNGRKLYFVSNSDQKPFTGWLPVAGRHESAFLYEPMSRQSGVAKVRKDANGVLEIFVSLAPAETIIIETAGEQIEGPVLHQVEASGKPLPLKGTWQIIFNEGGPEIPPSIETDSLASWTKFGSRVYPAFSGSATYTISFEKPGQSAKGWILDLGSVRETARVTLNGQFLATLIGPTYQLYIDAALLKEKNTLAVRVSNLMANRIADLDRRGVLWKKFYNVNVAAKEAANRTAGIFDAAQWEPKDSGLLGPVQLIPDLGTADPKKN